MNLLPAAIMFLLTVGMVAVFLLPATFERRSAVLNFYWVGTWLFLALLAAVSGGGQTVSMLGIDGTSVALRLQTALAVCFPLFVVFAWARLSGVALIAGVRRLRRA